MNYSHESKEAGRLADVQKRIEAMLASVHEFSLEALKETPQRIAERSRFERLTAKLNRAQKHRGTQARVERLRARCLCRKYLESKAG